MPTNATLIKSKTSQRRQFQWGSVRLCKAKNHFDGIWRSQSGCDPKMIEEPVTNELPASVLQKHDDVIVIIDEAAASKL